MIKLHSNLKNKPSWLEYVPNSEKPDVDVNFGFDDTGMWFYGNAQGTSYPIRSNFSFNSSEICEITFTFIHGDLVGGEEDNCSDQTICFFKVGDEPNFNWGGEDSTRIAYQINCGSPEISGLTGGVSEDLDLIKGDRYTAHLVYNPNVGLTATLHEGVKVNNNPISTLFLSDVLSEGEYRIGFDADKDVTGEIQKSYFTNLIIGNVDVATTSCDVCVNPGFNCYTPVSATTGSCSCRNWKMFYANCPKRNGQCSRYSKAYVPAITVCLQKLF